MCKLQFVGLRPTNCKCRMQNAECRIVEEFCPWQNSNVFSHQRKDYIHCSLCVVHCTFSVCRAQPDKLKFEAKESRSPRGSARHGGASDLPLEVTLLEAFGEGQSSADLVVEEEVEGGGLLHLSNGHTVTEFLGGDTFHNRVQIG